ELAAGDSERVGEKAVGDEREARPKKGDGENRLPHGRSPQEDRYDAEQSPEPEESREVVGQDQPDGRVERKAAVLKSKRVRSSEKDGCGGPRGERGEGNQKRPAASGPPQRDGEDRDPDHGGFFRQQREEERAERRDI